MAAAAGTSPLFAESATLISRDAAHGNSSDNIFTLSRIGVASCSAACITTFDHHENGEVHVSRFSGKSSFSVDFPENRESWEISRESRENLENRETYLRYGGNRRFGTSLPHRRVTSGRREVE